MELPNPDPTDVDVRPAHGGRDRHVCVGAPTASQAGARSSKSANALCSVLMPAVSTSFSCAREALCQHYPVQEALQQATSASAQMCSDLPVSSTLGPKRACRMFLW